MAGRPPYCLVTEWLCVVSCFQLGQFPSSYADYFNAMTQPTDWSSVFVCHTYLGSYYPHLYLIPGVILGFAQQTGFNAFVALSVSRVCAGLIYCFAAYWIIKLMPVGKNAVLIFLLNPILLQQEASVSADSVANIVAILYVAVVVKIYADSLYSYRSLLALILLSVLLLLSKIMFFPLVLLNLIHWKKLKGTDNYIKFIFSFFAIAFVASCAFVSLYHGSFMPDSFDLMRAPFIAQRSLLSLFGRWGHSGFNPMQVTILALFRLMFGHFVFGFTSFFSPLFCFITMRIIKNYSAVRIAL